jgi:putative FmdB family regulatory protein
MPYYDYACALCEQEEERLVAVDDRDSQWHSCGAKLFRLPSAPMGKMAGQVAKGGGPDRFTADMLGTTVKDLPKPLRSED